jgi:ribosome-binding factor A
LRDFSRSDRLSSQISRELSTMLLNNLTLPANIIISITEVELAKDLRIGKVYYSVYGGDDAVPKAEKFFKDNYKLIRKELAGKIRVKFIPELIFRHDPSIQREQRISELLDRIKEDENQS